MSKKSEAKSEADAPAVVETIRLVAVKLGYAMNRMVKPGEVFDFRVMGADGQPRKLPKWAQEAGKPLPAAPRGAADLKPIDAQKAVKAKAAALTGNA